MGGLFRVGVTTGNIGTINIRKMYQKQLTLMGSALGTVAELRTLVHLAGQGKLEPIIDRVLPLHRAGEAHLLLENRQNFGKNLPLSESSNLIGVFAWGVLDYVSEDFSAFTLRNS